jgi:hypothetical protein
MEPQPGCSFATGLTGPLANESPLRCHLFLRSLVGVAVAATT